MMINKEYYRLDDLKHRFDLTESDIRYLLEEGQIPLIFKVKPLLFIVGYFRKWDFVGRCSVSYEGLTRIPDTHIQPILSGKEVRPERFILLQRKRLRLKSTDYDIEEKWPNDYLQGWQPKSLNEMDDEVFHAKLYPRVQTNPLWQLKKATATALNFIDKSRSGEASAHTDEIWGDVPESVLAPDWLAFKLADLCVQHETLLQLGIVSSSSLSSEIHQNQTEPKRTKLELISPVFKYKNQFEELLARVITAHPELSAKNVCRILDYESLQEEDSRKFDTENILLDAVENNICWRDKFRNNAERTYTHNTIGNMICTLRKKIHQHTA
ncbi:hypothetical protein Q3O59_15255 [Alkalimonas delamerensis]|uniref:Uncharacterized protein n=1 Tax=Alkalimonas delamerensis TaxID=265981 RepID=A0ABT9GTT4_9GAMM|nr:hypothetical protein [Alkalimonas delamerensis]MDP4530387.1 hypothetical protein [Alkalimonas delamerensis]